MSLPTYRSLLNGCKGKQIRDFKEYIEDSSAFQFHLEEQRSLEAYHAYFLLFHAQTQT